MSGENAERRRSHPVEPTCLTHGMRLSRLELDAGLIRKAGHRIEIDAGQNQTFIPPEGLNVRDLALQIDVVFRIDLQMDGDTRVNSRQLRPNATDLLPANFGIGE